MLRILTVALKWISISAGVVLLMFGLAVALFGVQWVGEYLPDVAALFVTVEANPLEEYLLASVTEITTDGGSSVSIDNEGRITQDGEIVPSEIGKEPAGPPPDRIVIPAIKLDAPVVKGGTLRYQVGNREFEQWIVPDEFAAGWNPNSYTPGSGENVVLYGHNNVHGAVFKYLYKLEPGDSISLFVGDSELSYVVEEVQKLQEKDTSVQQMLENARWIAPTGDERLTLVTCWPPFQSTHRLIVVAKPR
ncbi:MAG: sortase [Anaerolineae bacterium]|nr:sortase [Anaerolineae bacterium]